MTPGISVDLIIFDVNTTMGLGIIKELARVFKNAKLLLLSSLTDVRIIKQIFKEEVQAFISKHSNLQDLLTGIEEASAGRKYICNNMRAKLISKIAQEENSMSDTTAISARERELLTGMCEGLSIKEIGHKIGITPHTVHYHQRRLMKKLKVSRPLDLIMYAMQQGLYTYNGVSDAK